VPEPESVRKDIVAVAPCGCIRGWISGKEDPKSYRKEIAGWVADGLEIRHVTTEEARSGQWNCEAVHPKVGPKMPKIRPDTTRQLTLGGGTGAKPGTP
jgi:hypothetical protein